MCWPVRLLRARMGAWHGFLGSPATRSCPDHPELPTWHPVAVVIAASAVPYAHTYSDITNIRPIDGT